MALVFGVLGGGGVIGILAIVVRTARAVGGYEARFAALERSHAIIEEKLNRCVTIPTLADLKKDLETLEASLDAYLPIARWVDQSQHLHERIAETRAKLDETERRLREAERSIPPPPRAAS